MVNKIKNMAICLVLGNAAITLRSRLKVKVVKDMLQRTGQQPHDLEPPEQQQEGHNGLLPHGHTNSETGKVTLQLQVSTKVVMGTCLFRRSASRWAANLFNYINQAWLCVCISSVEPQH